jgi:ribosomal protein L37AE/L43A
MPCAECATPNGVTHRFCKKCGRSLNRRRTAGQLAVSRVASASVTNGNGATDANSVTSAVATGVANGAANGAATGVASGVVTGVTNGAANGAAIGAAAIGVSNGAVRRVTPVTNRRKHQCRACRSTSVERDWSVTRFERIMLPLIGFRIYLCRDCHVRFYDRPIHHLEWA